MTDSVLHWPFLMGHSFLQLQGRVVFFLLRFFSILLLWLSIMFFIEGHVRKLILHFFLFITGWRGWVMGKCLSNSCRNNCPNFVLREDVNGGLNQRIFFLFLDLVFLSLLILSSGSWSVLGGVGMTRGWVKVTGSVVWVRVWLFWLAVLCVALSRRRCERRGWVGGSCSGWLGEADGLVWETRSGVWLGWGVGGVGWWSALSLVEFSLRLAEILRLVLSFM